jgi:hypothetical protein
MISPSGRVPEQGPDWFLVATEACGSGTPDLGFFLGVSGFIGIFGVGFTSGGSTRRRQGRRTRPGGGGVRPPAPVQHDLVPHNSKRASSTHCWYAAKLETRADSKRSVCVEHVRRHRRTQLRHHALGPPLTQDRIRSGGSEGRASSCKDHDVCEQNPDDSETPFGRRKTI